MISGRTGALATLLLVVGVGMAHADLNSKMRLRAFAKLPDWSGIWEQFYIDPSGFGGQFNLFIEAAKEQAHPPYNAEWQAKFDSVRRSIRDAPPWKSCAFGFPALSVGSPLMFQAIVTPEETTLIYNQRETRHVLTDGRRHPSADDLFATQWGDSIGHWEGQTLVVDTIGTSSALFGVDETGTIPVPVTFSEQARYIERIRMKDKNTLENQLTIEDPIALTRPWRLAREYHRVTAIDRLVDEDCNGNDRNPVVDGKFIIAPPVR